jgi:hypothetical protein
MKYVLDTNVIKKISGKNRNGNIDKWLSGIDDKDLYVTSLSLQEIQKGIELLKRNADPEKAKTALKIQRELDAWLTQMEDRVLPLDAKAAREWGRRLAKHGTKSANDLAIISIVAVQDDATAVTQNLADFRHRGIRVLNPYTDPPTVHHDPES